MYVEDSLTQFLHFNLCDIICPHVLIPYSRLDSAIYAESVIENQVFSDVTLLSLSISTPVSCSGHSHLPVSTVMVGIHRHRQPRTMLRYHFWRSRRRSSSPSQVWSGSVAILASFGSNFGFSLLTISSSCSKVGIQVMKFRPYFHMPGMSRARRTHPYVYALINSRLFSHYMHRYVTAKATSLGPLDPPMELCSGELSGREMI